MGKLEFLTFSSRAMFALILCCTFGCDKMFRELALGAATFVGANRNSTFQRFHPPKKKNPGKHAWQCHFGPLRTRLLTQRVAFGACEDYNAPHRTLFSFLQKLLGGFGIRLFQEKLTSLRVVRRNKQKEAKKKNIEIRRRRSSKQNTV